MSYKFTKFLRSSELCHGCLKLIHFSKKSGRLSSTNSEILDFGSHCSANFQQILDCFVPNFKLQYDNLENIKTDRANTVIFNLHQIKQSKFFFWDNRYLGNGSDEISRKVQSTEPQSYFPLFRVLGLLLVKYKTDSTRELIKFSQTIERR